MARIRLWWRYPTSWRRLGSTDITDPAGGGLGSAPLGTSPLGG